MKKIGLAYGLCLLALAAVTSCSTGPGGAGGDKVVTIDRLVRRTSDIPANAGQPIDLFVREKVSLAMLGADGKAPAGKVVLFVHGGYSSAVLAFDVAYRDYSWMGYLAQAGYDVFGMDMTGYGQSSRPMMDDPCNLSPKQQPLLVPKNLSAPCQVKYPYQLVSSDTETADIDRVVDSIRAMRKVDKVTLIGWSGGGIRTGTYTVRHPDKIEKLIIEASSNYSRKNPDQRPELPKAGAPMTIQMRDVADKRWLGTQKCDGVIEPGMPDHVWKLNMEDDPVGATWGSGGLRAPTRTYWGWNANAAGKIAVPTLIMVGEEDRLLTSNRELFDDLGTKRKAMIEIACGTHFMVWEKQRQVLHSASLEWLNTATVNGMPTGRYHADVNGKITAAR